MTEARASAVHTGCAVCPFVRVEDQKTIRLLMQKGSAKEGDE